MIKTLKNLFVVSLLGLVLLGCEESSSLADANWETFADPNKSGILISGTEQRLDDIGQTSEDGLRLIGAKDRKVAEAAAIADFGTATVQTKGGHLVKVTAIDGVVINLDVDVTPSDDNTSVSIDTATIITNSPDANLKAGSGIAKLSFYAPDDVNMETTLGDFILAL